jgi:hypothetical protein
MLQQRLSHNVWRLCILTYVCMHGLYITTPEHILLPPPTTQSGDSP